MSDYNFEHDDGQFGETKRLDTINKEVKKIEISKKTKRPGSEDELGDKNAFLDVFESEDVDSNRNEEHKDTSNTPVSEEDTPNPMDREQKSNMKMLVAMASVIGVLLFMGGFYMFRYGKGDAKPPVVESPISTEGALMLVKDITDEQGLLVFDITTNKEYTVGTGKDTKFQDREGAAIDLSGIAPGDILEVVLAEDGQTAEKVSFSSKTFLEEDMTGLQIEPSTMSILVKGKKEEPYLYSEDTLFLYDGNFIEPESLAPSDVVVLQGFEEQVWSVKVITYHGYLLVKNKHTIQGGTLQMDGGKPKSIEGMERIPISEGAHSLIINGSNIEAYKASVFIVPGEDFIVDLSAAQEKTGVLIIKASVPDCKIYINGAVTNHAEPVVLNHGDYDIVVLKNGYKTWNKKITLNQPTMTITANLEEDIQKGSVTIETTPRNASVFLDSVEIGTSPIQKQLPYGNYNLLIKLEGYEIYTNSIVVNKPSDTITIRLTELEE